MRQIFYAALSAAFVLNAAAAAERFDAKIIGVADGDTLSVLLVAGQTKTPRRVRLSVSGKPPALFLRA